MKACACSLMSMVYVNDIAVLVIAANAIIVGGPLLGYVFLHCYCFAPGTCSH